MAPEDVRFMQGLNGAGCAGHKRKLRVTAAPNVTLSMQHVPRHCRGARTILLGPLTPQDLDAATFVPPVPSTLFCCTMTFESTANVLAECKLKYYRTSECAASIAEPSFAILKT